MPESIAGGAVPAQVPGSVHTDLLAAGLIADPYLDRTRPSCAWMHRVDWRYETHGDVPPRRRPTSGSTWSSTGSTRSPPSARRRVLGRTANMHRSYRFDVATCWPRAAQPLAVHFARALRTPSGGRGSASGRTPTRIRTTPCARWPAASAGTGDRTWRPPASGGRCAWSAGAIARLADGAPAGDARPARTPARPRARRRRALRAGCTRPGRAGWTSRVGDRSGRGRRLPTGAADRAR